MTTIVDITPRPPRRRALWIVVPLVAVALVLATWLPARSKIAPEEVMKLLQVERSAYLLTLCTIYDTGEPSGSDGVDEAGRELCACVRDADNPAKACNTFLRVWVVLRDHERCASELAERAPSYCACVEPVARLVSRAGGMDVARRRAYGYDQCRGLDDAPPMPPPAPETLITRPEHREKEHQGMWQRDAQPLPPVSTSEASQPA